MVTPAPSATQGPIQRELAALWTTILVVLLAPVWLAYQAYQKYHEWQKETFASQEEVMKQPPVAVMVCKPGCFEYSIEEMVKLRVVSPQPSQENGMDLIVLAPSKGEKDEWITCQVKSGEALNESNFSCFNSGLLFV